MWCMFWSILFAAVNSEYFPEQCKVCSEDKYNPIGICVLFKSLLDFKTLNIWKETVESLEVTFCKFPTVNYLPLDDAKDLEYLSIKHAAFITWPVESFKYQTKLKDLSLSHNKITMLPENLFKFTQALEEIDLSHNEIQSIPENLFTHLRKVKQISFCHNFIDKLPTDLLNTPSKLVIIHLSHNNIKEIPEHFFSNQLEIENMSLSHNHLTALSQFHFKNLSRLHSLDLSSNKFETFNYEVVSNLTNLLYLNIENNRIKEFPGEYTVRLQSSLTTLILSHNFLTTLNSSILTSLTSLKNFDIEGNPFICDCNLQKIILWSVENNFNFDAFCLLKHNNTVVSWSEINAYNMCFSDYSALCPANSVPVNYIVGVTLSVIVIFIMFVAMAILVRKQMSKKEQTLPTTRGPENNRINGNLSDTEVEANTETNEQIHTAPDVMTILSASTCRVYENIPMDSLSPRRTQKNMPEVTEENLFYGKL